jgi:predicted DNA-binding protein
MDIYRVNKDRLVTEMIMRDQPKDELGRFVSPYDEPLSKKVVGVRLPQSIYERLQQLAEEQSKSPGEILRELAQAVLTQSDSQPLSVSEGRLEKTRDTVLSKLRLGKQSQGAKAINQFIKEGAKLAKLSPGAI